MNPKVWFWIRNTKKKRAIYFRIILNGTDTNNGHSTKIKVDEAHWLQDEQQVSHKCPKAKIYNAMLLDIETNLLKFWQGLGADRTNLTAMQFYSLYLDSLCPRYVPTTADVWNEWLKIIEKRVSAHKITNATLISWKTAKRNFEKWLLSNEFESLPITKIKQTDFENIELFYLSDLGLENNYCAKQLAMVKTVMNFAKRQGYLLSNPFEGQSKKKVMKDIKFLEMEELRTIEAYQPDNATFEKVRDFFLFQCYTGLDYVDVLELTNEHLVTDEKGTWIVKQRHKTQNHDAQFLACIPLFVMPKSMEIIEKYGIGNLPKLTNQRMNLYLKCICEILKIKKPISTKYSRRTFAMRMLNEFGFSKEAVGVMLGDRDLDVVQTHYARANKSRVETELKKLGLTAV